MGSGGSKVRHGGVASSSLSSGRRGRSKGSKVFQSSCLGAPSGSRDSDNEDQVFYYGNKENAGHALCEEQTESDMGQGKTECFTKEKAEHSDGRSCISSNLDLDQSVQPSISNTSFRNGSNAAQASFTHSLNPPSRFLSHFSFIPRNVSFRLSRTTSSRSSGSCPIPNTSLSMLNGGKEICQCSGSDTDSLDRNEAQQITDLLPPPLNNTAPTHYHENNSHSFQLNGPVSDVLDNIQSNQTISSIPEVSGNGGSDIARPNISLHSPGVIGDLNGIETRLSDRRVGARQPVERNVRFSRTLSVGRLRDRVLRRSSLSDLTFCPLEQSGNLRDASQGTGRQAMGGETALSTFNAMSPAISDNRPSNISNPTFSTLDNELEMSRSREGRHHDLLEHRSNFLERRRRIRSQVRALQRLGSRFENLSGHERSCILSGQNRTGRCTCRVSNRTGNLNDDTGARASISRIVMLAEALFEVLDEIHQQSVVLSTRPSVPSIGSIPAPNEVVESLPIKLYTKLQKYQLEETAQCYICLVEYEEGDSLRILPCNHEFHRACIDKWLKEIHRVCPLCRGDICNSESAV